LFPSGVAPLTTPAHQAASISARVDHAEDPLDLYRIWAPAKRTLRARVTGAVRVRLLERANRVRSLALGKNGVAVYRNPGAGRYVYVEVLPATRLAEYQLRITAARK
jgi:hypothetical protein